MLHKTIPTDIHVIKSFFGILKAIPIAAPTGTPNISGDINLKPIVPYLF